MPPGLPDPRFRLTVRCPSSDLAVAKGASGEAVGLTGCCDLREACATRHPSLSCPPPGGPDGRPLVNVASTIRGAHQPDLGRSGRSNKAHSGVRRSDRHDDRMVPFCRGFEEHGGSEAMFPPDVSAGTA
jgi:hypothetical protein